MTIEEKKADKEAESVWAKFAYTASDGKTYQVDYYNLDVIISVGYRVKSVQGTKFRIWATSILRQYLLQGYSVNRHLIALQENIKRMTHIEDTQAKQQQQLDFFIRTSPPPAEMVFFEGDFYTARVALENLVSSANHRQFFIPKGFAHGFAVLSETAVFQYKCDNFYHPEADGGISILDDTLGIDWKIPTEHANLSEKDTKHAMLKDFDSPFDINVDLYK